MKLRKKKAISILSAVVITSTIMGGNATQVQAWTPAGNQSVIDFEDRGTQPGALTDSYQGCNFGNTGWNTGDIGGSVGLWADNFTSNQQVNKIAIPYGKIFRGFTAQCGSTATVEVKSGKSVNTFQITNEKQEFKTDFTTPEMGAYLVITSEKGADDVKFDDLLLEDGDLTRLNISQGKPVTTSNTSQKPGSNGNDGDLNTMWVNQGSGVNKWWQVDLGESYNLSEFDLFFEKDETPNAWKYKIEGSNNGTAFDLLVDKTENTDGAREQKGVFAANTKYRYVRVTITGTPKSTYWCGFSEFMVYTDQTMTNVALNKSAKQSHGFNSADLAVDGDTSTFSGNTGTFPYTWEVDLKETYRIKDVELEWQDLRDGTVDIAEDWKYKIESSLDGETWNTVVDYSVESPYTDPSTSLVQRETIDTDSNKLRVTIVDKPAKKPLAWAIIPEFRAFAEDKNVPVEPGQMIVTNLAAYKPVIASSTAEGYNGENITDGKADTSWKPANPGEESWLQIDLGKFYNITDSAVTFADGTQENVYTMLVSEDKDTWTKAEDTPVRARYVKLVFEKPTPDLEVKSFTAEGSEASTEPKKILVLAPHEDDEMLMAGGVIHDAVNRGDSVKVVFATNGDYNGQSTGVARIKEAVASLAHIGLQKDDILFMGYADTGGLGGVQTYWDSFLYKLYTSGDDEVLSSRWNNKNTYGAPGFKEDYHFEKTGEHAEYTRNSFLGDLKMAIQDFMPDDIYVPSRYDMHFDHAYFDLFAIEALQDVKDANVGYSPVLHESIIHSCAGDSKWPTWNDDKAGVVPFTMPEGLETLTMFDWNQRESVTVPYNMRQSPFQYNLKDQALRIYTSQYYGYIGAFARFDEIFWTRDFESVAHNAVVTASSEQAGTDKKTDSSAAKAVDGVRDGYAPGLTFGHVRFPHAEWVTKEERENAWINLDLDSSKTVDKVVLYDRPNTEDQVMSGILEFSDGSQVEVGALPNDGRPLEVSFSARETASVKFIVNSVSDTTKSVGLAEIEVYSVK